MKKIFFLILSVVLCFGSYAQKKSKGTKDDKREQRKVRISALAKQEEEGVIAYRKHFLAGIKLTTSGYGGFIEIGRAQSVSKSLLFQLDISEQKDPKEDKQQVSNASPFVYGKINFLYPVKLGVQQQFLLGNKGNKNGVSVTANVGGGLLLGLLRPYKLDRVDSLGNQQYFGVKNDTLNFLTLANVRGGPSFTTGFNQLSVVPGLYTKAGLRFDYGKYNETVSALEVGVTAEYYSKNVPIIIFAKDKKFFLSAYVSLLFGKRKT
jgi:hypothetical protein